MEAPDKIYCGNNGHGNLSYSSVKVYDTMSEYIRKDALLEWAKKHQEGERQGSYTWSCYQIFIDKLNKM